MQAKALKKRRREILPLVSAQQPLFRHRPAGPKPDTRKQKHSSNGSIEDQRSI